MNNDFLKKIFFLVFVVSVIGMASCDNDDDGDNPVNALIGTWNVTAVQATGANIGTVDATVSGTIKFNADGTGQESYSWTAFGVTRQESNGFTWISTSSTITFDPGDVDQTIWDREINESDQQRGSFETIVDGEMVTLRITLSK